MNVFLAQYPFLFLSGYNSPIFLWRKAFVYHLGFCSGKWNHWRYFNQKCGLYRKINAYKITGRARGIGVSRTLLIQLSPSIYTTVVIQGSECSINHSICQTKLATKQWVLSKITTVALLPYDVQDFFVLSFGKPNKTTTASQNKKKQSRKFSSISRSSYRSHSSAYKWQTLFASQNLAIRGSSNIVFQLFCHFCTQKFN